MRDERSNTRRWDRVPRQQSGLVGLMETMLGAYMDLLRLPFALYRVPFSLFQMEVNAVEAVMRQAQHPAKEVAQLVPEATTEQVNQLAKQVTQQVVEASSEQINQLAEQATQRAIEAATEQVNQLAKQAALPMAEAAGRETATNTEGEHRLPLYEEQLQVQKRPIETGKVRLSKEVVTEQKTINVPVTREEMVIEHLPGSGQVSQTPLAEGETIRIPLSEEQVNVTKQTVETGEVVLGKRQVQETQQVSETVRREEARLEREGQVKVQESDLNGSRQQPEH